MMGAGQGILPEEFFSDRIIPWLCSSCACYKMPLRYGGVCTCTLFRSVITNGTRPRASLPIASISCSPLSIKCNLFSACTCLIPPLFPQATLIGSRIFIFGGEDFARRPQSDLYILDMADTAWRTPESLNPSSNEPSTSSQPTPTQPPPQGPSARSAHVAACVGGRFLLVFGGGSIANCFNDLWSLDTQTMVWSQPATEGEPPCPRAGALGPAWCDGLVASVLMGGCVGCG